MMVFVQLQLNRGKRGEAYLLFEVEKMFFFYCILHPAMEHEGWICQKTAVEGIKSSLLSQDMTSHHLF